MQHNALSCGAPDARRSALGVPEARRPHPTHPSPILGHRRSCTPVQKDWSGTCLSPEASYHVWGALISLMHPSCDKISPLAVPRRRRLPRWASPRGYCSGGARFGSGEASRRRCGIASVTCEQDAPRIGHRWPPDWTSASDWWNDAGANSTVLYPPAPWRQRFVRPPAQTAPTTA